MLKSRKRRREFISLCLALAVAVSGVNTAFAEEIGVEAPARVEEVGDAFAEDQDTLQEASTESLVHAGGNTYYGGVTIKPDGEVYAGDASSTEKAGELSGFDWDKDTNTLTLTDFHLGSEYDDVYDDGKTSYLWIFLEDKWHVANANKDLTIVLHGHNTIGSYSNYSRINNMVSGIDGFVRSVTFTGDGDLVMHGHMSLTRQIDNYQLSEFHTDLPVWGSDEGRGTLNLNYEHNYQYSKENIKSISMNIFNHVGYLKIGGEKPDKPVYLECDEIITKDLGTIGGHSVSVCYTSNVIYDSRKIVNYAEYQLCATAANDFSDYIIYDNDTFFPAAFPGDVLSVNSLKTYGDNHANFYYSDEKKSSNTTSKVPSMHIKVFVDGTPIPNVFVKTKFKNNVNASSDGKFSFSLKDKYSHKISKKEKESIVDTYKNSMSANYSINDIHIDNPQKTLGYDKSFYKALKDYFKNKNNWLTFTIIPKDIIKAGFSSKNESVLIFLDPFMPIDNNKLKKYIKMDGDTIKKIVVTTYIPVGHGGEKEIIRKLKWDKKYSGGNLNPKANFHVEVISGNYIRITGQGNYTNSVTIKKPN